KSRAPRFASFIFFPVFTNLPKKNRIIAIHTLRKQQSIGRRATLVEKRSQLLGLTELGHFNSFRAPFSAKQ
ncbi:hypothetical protein M5D96_009821, partial [Drosophila gunungcola]